MIPAIAMVALAVGFAVDASSGAGPGAGAGPGLKPVTTFRERRLVVLRLGLGRDSMTMLVLLAQHKLLVEGQLIGPDDVDAVVFTDPGHEWQFTYDLIPRVQKFCDRFGLRFLWQKKPPAEGPDGWIAWMGHQIESRKAGQSFGTPPWRLHRPVTIEERCASGYYHQRIPLFDDYGSKDAWIAKDDSSCTVVHKIVPNRELLVDLQMERFGPQPERQGTRRQNETTRQGEAWGDGVRFGARRPHLMLIGYAADELERLSEVKEKVSKSVPWTLDFDTEAYPLMEMGIPKTGEQAVLDAEFGVSPDQQFVAGGFADTRKSGCRSCKEQDAAQWWMLRTLDPTWFAQMVDHERRVVARTGPWQAIFPKKFVAVLFARRGKNELQEEFAVRARAEARVNPLAIAAQQEGYEVTFARQVKVADPETDGSGAGSGLKKKWIRIPEIDPAQEVGEADRAFAHVWVPIDRKVDVWLAGYRKTFGREPVWEEVAKKEYRGGCAAAALAE